MKLQKLEQNPKNLLKLSINVSIKHVTTLLQSTPEELLKGFDVKHFTDPQIVEWVQKPEDAIYIQENLQEILNCLLDARRRLIRLGTYNLGASYEEKGIRKGPISGIRTGEEIPEILEGDRNSHNNPIPISPDEEMEI